MIIRVLAALAALTPFGAPAFAQASDVTVTVTYPVSGQVVDQEITATGTTTDPSVPLVIVVHPTAIVEHFVQAEPSRNDDGTWTARVHFGRPGLDVGAAFEMQVIAGATAEGLSEGAVLTSFPSGAGASPVVRDLVRR